MDRFPRAPLPEVPKAIAPMDDTSAPYAAGQRAAAVAQEALNTTADYLAKQNAKDKQIKDAMIEAQMREQEPLLIDSLHAKYLDQVKAADIEGIRKSIADGDIHKTADELAMKFPDGEYRQMARARFLTTGATVMTGLLNNARDMGVANAQSSFHSELATGIGFVSSARSAPAGSGWDSSIKDTYMQQLAAGKGVADSPIGRVGFNDQQRKQELYTYDIQLSGAALDAIRATSEKLFTDSGFNAAKAEQYLRSQIPFVEKDLAKPVGTKGVTEIENWIQAYRQKEMENHNARILSFTNGLATAVNKEASVVTEGDFDPQAITRAEGHVAMLEKVYQQYEKNPQYGPIIQTALETSRDKVAKMKLELADAQESVRIVDGAVDGTAAVLPGSNLEKRVDQRLAKILNNPAVDAMAGLVTVNNVFSSLSGPNKAGSQYYGNVLNAAMKDETGNAAMILVNGVTSLEGQNPGAWAKFVKTDTGRQAFQFSTVYQLQIASGASPQAAITAAGEAVRRPYNAEVVTQRLNDLDMPQGKAVIGDVIKSNIDSVMNDAFKTTKFGHNLGNNFFGDSFMKGVEANQPGYRAVYDRIVARAKTAYGYLTATGDMENDLKSALNYAAKDVSNEFEFSGGNFKRGTPFTFAGSAMTSEAMKQDITGLMTTQGASWVDSPETARKLLDNGMADWFGDQNNGWVMFIRKGSSLRPVLDKHGYPFVYKPQAAITQDVYVPGTKPGEGTYVKKPVAP